MEGGSGEQISRVSIKENFEMTIGIGSFWPHHVQAGSQFPDQGLNPYPLHWKCGVSITRSPGETHFSGGAVGKESTCQCRRCEG